MVEARARGGRAARVGQRSGSGVEWLFGRKQRSGGARARAASQSPQPACQHPGAQPGRHGGRLHAERWSVASGSQAAHLGVCEFCRHRCRS